MIVQALYPYPRLLENGRDPPQLSGWSSGSVSRSARNEAIRMAIIQYPGVTAEQILSLSRIKHIVHTRQYAIWLLREQRRIDGKHRYSYPALAHAFGLVDHTTSRHAWLKVQARLAEQGRAA